MGLIDLIFGRRPKQEPKTESRFETLTAYSPQFRSWGGKIYESDLIRSALDAHARHIAKLKYEMYGSAHRDLWTITKSAPNQWMTWPQFLERCSNIYYTENNLFIVPVLEGPYRDIRGYWPVLPSTSEVVEVGGTPYLRFEFVNGKAALPLGKVAVVPRFQLKDDFFGENNKPLNSTLALANMINQGIQEGVKNSATYRFMAQTTTHTFDEDLRKERQRFDELNFQSGDGGGLLLFGANMTNVKQIDPQHITVDPKQSELILKNVSNYFGVSEKVMQNTANGDDLDAFYNGAIETFAIKLSDALTKLVYTQTERNNGNCITFTANRLQYMSVTAKVSMAQQLGDRGALLIDEIRELFNYQPLPDGAGQHAPIRGEYYMVDEGKGPDADGNGAGDPAGNTGGGSEEPGTKGE